MPDQRYIRRPWETPADAPDGGAQRDPSKSRLGADAHDRLIGETARERLRDVENAFVEYPPRLNPDPAQGPPVAGWYDDPSSTGIRYWSGSEWTDQVAAKPGARVPPISPPPGGSTTSSGRWLHANWRWLVAAAGALVIGAGAGAAAGTTHTKTVVRTDASAATKTVTNTRTITGSAPPAQVKTVTQTVTAPASRSGAGTGSSNL